MITPQKLWVVLLLTTTAQSCGQEVADRPSISIDDNLTADLALGEVTTIWIQVDNCASPSDLVLAAGETSLLSVASPQVGEVIESGTQREVISVDLNQGTLRELGLGKPQAVSLVASIKCRAETVASAPHSIVMIATQAGFQVSFAIRRFWAAREPGSLWLCDNGQLLLQTPSSLTNADLDFSCGLAEMRGRLGSTRYIWSEGSGLAAIDANDEVLWQRIIPLQELVVTEEGPVVITKDQELYRWERLDVTDGLTVVSSDPIAEAPLGSPGITSDGEVLILWGERSTADVLSYQVSRFEPTGARITTLEVHDYEWAAPSYLAQFSPDATQLTMTLQASADDPRTVASFRITDEVSLEWQTSGSAETFEYSLAHFGEHVLVAGDDQLSWLDADDGSPTSAAMSLGGSSSFLRGTIEEDLVFFALGQPLAEAARGLFIFNAAGESIVDVSITDSLFRWMTPAWEGAPLIGLPGQIHWLYRADTYASFSSDTQ